MGVRRVAVSSTDWLDVRRIVTLMSALQALPTPHQTKRTEGQQNNAEHDQTPVLRLHNRIGSRAICPGRKQSTAPCEGSTYRNGKPQQTASKTDNEAQNAATP